MASKHSSHVATFFYVRWTSSFFPHLVWASASFLICPLADLVACLRYARHFSLALRAAEVQIQDLRDRKKLTRQREQRHDDAFRDPQLRQTRPLLRAFRKLLARSSANASYAH
jgi:hypothetical protein